MVLSRITSMVDYDEEDYRVHSEDVGHESSLFESVLFKKKVILTLGKVKFSFIDKGVVFYPIYLVSKVSIPSGYGGTTDKYAIIRRIGVYEMNKNDFINNIKDNSNEVNMSLLKKPIIFENSFNVVHIHRTLPKIVVKEAPKIVVPDVPKIVVDDAVDDFVDDLELGISDISHINNEIDKSLKDGIFTKHDREKTSLNHDEGKETAENITKSYRQSSNDNWIKKMMKNPHYELKDVDDNNSFFNVVKDAFEKIGYYTTVHKLRCVVAKNTTDNYLNDRRILFAEYKSQLTNLRTRMMDIKRTIEVDMRNQIKNSILTKGEQKVIIDKCNILKDEFDRMNKLKMDTTKIIDDTFGKDFEKITSLEKYKESIVSNKCFVNSNTISILERELNVKLIVFSENDREDQNEVIKVEKKIDGKINYKPDYYILCSFKNERYKKLLYKGKEIMEFSEIPYHIKIMILKKKMAGISGNYSVIEDFKNYASFIGIKKELLNIDENNGNSITDRNLYDPSIQLMFYSKSSEKIAGDGNGDLVDITDIHLFTELSCTSNWRKKIDDSWVDLEHPFSINNKQYASVVHYYQGSKYKNGFPDFADQFALNSGSKISKDLQMCYSASSSGSITINNDIIRLRPKNVSIDPDFYRGRNIIERQKATDSKFTQKLHLREILLNTQNAQLNHYIGNKKPEIAVALMKTRSNLRN
jgi:hypothetical protein